MIILIKIKSEEIQAYNVLAVSMVLGHFGHGHFGHGRFGQDVSATDISATDISANGYFGHGHFGHGIIHSICFCSCESYGLIFLGQALVRYCHFGVSPVNSSDSDSDVIHHFTTLQD